MKIPFAWIIVIALGTWAVGCGDGLPAKSASTADGGGGCVGSCSLLVTGEAPSGFPAGPLTDTAPADNALTEPRAQLGKKLFFDPSLSRTRTVSCGSCHVQEHAFADPRPVSLGVDDRQGTRNAPALANLAWGSSFFWDGRARTLEEQAGQPIENALEMDMTLAEVVDRLQSDSAYQPLFRAAYGEEVSSDGVRKALASFVRTLVSGGSRYDRFLGGDLSALTPLEQQGKALFFSERGECFHCHPAGALTNDGFFNNGSFLEGGDVGRKMITGRSGDLGKFRVPGLRNIAVTAPYMHDGSAATLEDVIDRYDRGGLGHASTDPQIMRLGLTLEERQALLAFLQSLTDSAFLTDPRFKP